MPVTAQQTIAKMVPILAPMQQTKIVVNGYTDNVPIGPGLMHSRGPYHEYVDRMEQYRETAEAVCGYPIRTRHSERRMQLDEIFDISVPSRECWSFFAAKSAGKRRL